MLSLQPHHITDMYCFVDESLPKEQPTKTGRPKMLSDAELITILLWNTLVLHHETLKDIHAFSTMYLGREFPKLPSYPSFVRQCHETMPKMLGLLQSLLHDQASLRLVDSTMLLVCVLHRANRHKTAKESASFGKNHGGWHYGFKLHVTTDMNGCLASMLFSPAGMYDAQALPKLLDEHVKVLVGDTLSGARVMRDMMHTRFGTIIVSPPWPKQKTKLATSFQNFLLSERSRIESVFGILKKRLYLVTSFPRSLFGYFVHYVRILLGYQILALLRGM